MLLKIFKILFFTISIQIHCLFAIDDIGIGSNQNYNQLLDADKVYNINFNGSNSSFTQLNQPKNLIINNMNIGNNNSIYFLQSEPLPITTPPTPPITLKINNIESGGSLNTVSAKYSSIEIRPWNSSSNQYLSGMEKVILENASIIFLANDNDFPIKNTNNMVINNLLVHNGEVVLSSTDNLVINKMYVTGESGVKFKLDDGASIILNIDHNANISEIVQTNKNPRILENYYEFNIAKNANVGVKKFIMDSSWGILSKKGEGSLIVSNQQGSSSMLDRIDMHDGYLSLEYIEANTINLIKGKINLQYADNGSMELLNLKNYEQIEQDDKKIIFGNTVNIKNVGLPEGENLNDFNKKFYLNVFVTTMANTVEVENLNNNKTLQSLNEGNVNDFTDVYTSSNSGEYMNLKVINPFIMKTYTINTISDTRLTAVNKREIGDLNTYIKDIFVKEYSRFIFAVEQAENIGVNDNLVIIDRIERDEYASVIVDLLGDFNSTLQITNKADINELKSNKSTFRTMGDVSILKYSVTDTNTLDVLSGAKVYIGEVVTDNEADRLNLNIANNSSVYFNGESKVFDINNRGNIFVNESLLSFNTNLNQGLVTVDVKSDFIDIEDIVYGNLKQGIKNYNDINNLILDDNYIFNVKITNSGVIGLYEDKSLEVAYSDDKIVLNGVSINNQLAYRTFNFNYDLYNDERSLIVTLKRIKTNSLALEEVGGVYASPYNLKISRVLDDFILTGNNTKSVIDIISVTDHLINNDIDAYVDALSTLQPINNNINTIISHKQNNNIKTLYKNNKNTYQGEGWNLLTAYAGSFGRLKDKTLENNNSYDGHNLMLGMEYDSDSYDFIFGLATGYSEIKSEGTYKINNTNFSIFIDYTKYILEKFYVNLNTIHNINSLRGKRDDFIDYSAKYNTYVNETSLGFEFGYTFEMDTYKITPAVFYNYSLITNDGYNESGDGILYNVKAYSDTISDYGTNIDFSKNHYISKDHMILYNLGIGAGFNSYNLSDTKAHIEKINKDIEFNSNDYNGVFYKIKLGTFYEYKKDITLGLEYTTTINYGFGYDGLVKLSFKYFL